MLKVYVDDQVLFDLAQQCQDAGSKLRRGQHTRYATSIHAAPTAHLPTSHPTPPAHVPQKNEEPPVSLTESAIAVSSRSPPVQQASLLEIAHGEGDTDLQETRRFALIQKMQRLQQCRDECREEAAAAVADLRRKCAAELQEELEEELRCIKVEHERVREETLATLHARLQEELRQDALQLELHREQERDAQDALRLRRLDLDDQLTKLEEECAKKLADTRVACEEELRALLAHYQEESLNCEEQRRTCEEKRAKGEDELAALQLRYDAACAAATRAHEAHVAEEARQYEHRREEMLREWCELEQSQCPSLFTV